MGRITGRLADAKPITKPDYPPEGQHPAPSNVLPLAPTTANVSGELPPIPRKLCSWWGGDLRRPFGCGEWYDPPQRDGQALAFWEWDDGRIHPAICCRTCAKRLAFNPDHDETDDERERRKWAAVAELRKLC